MPRPHGLLDDAEALEMCLVCLCHQFVAGFVLLIKRWCGQCLPLPSGCPIPWGFDGGRGCNPAKTKNLNANPSHRTLLSGGLLLRHGLSTGYQSRLESCVSAPGWALGGGLQSRTTFVFLCEGCEEPEAHPRRSPTLLQGMASEIPQFKCKFSAV